ncbi:MAG: type II secretion system protein [Vulcanimicrobiota bacterium]
MKLNRRNGGFTLMEIVVVMGIISVLFCIFGTMGYVRAKARTTYVACCENLRSIGTGLQLYDLEKRKFPTELTSLTPYYIAKIPLCPAANVDTYTDGYKADSVTQDNFTVYCEGSYHITLGLDSNFPQYSYQWGLSEW